VTLPTRQSLEGIRLGVPEELTGEGIEPGVLAAFHDTLEKAKQLGATVETTHLPHAPHGLAAYYLIAPAECSSNLARYDGVRYGLREDGPGGLLGMYTATRDKGFGPEAKRRVLIGTYVLSAGFYDAYFTKAQKVRALIKQDFARAFEQCDVILTPTAPSAAFGIGETTDPLAMYLNDVFAVPASLAGLPAMSVPGGLDAQGLPLGLHLIGNALDEQTVLDAGLAIEERAGFTARAEKWW
jgi:aspartyl-tRNA(Asn)/glutamyl-tRNA(Gln) amidotransferase subunit A